MFTPEFFAGNRDALQRVVKGPIVIHSGSVQTRNGDGTYPFRVSSNFWYLTGLSIPGATLVLNGDNTQIILPALNAVQKAFDGDYDTAEYQKLSGIATFITGEAPEPTDADDALANLRVVKQPEEIAAIQRAIDITSETLQDVAARIKTYQHEYEIEADLSQGFRRRGATGHAFNPIVASGQHAVTLHYDANNGELEPGKPIQLDVGAEYQCYAADISRSVAQEPFSVRATSVFEAVERVQKDIISRMKPGATFKTIEQATEKAIATEIKALGLSGEDVRTYYPHSVSHFVGLDVHDVGDYHRPLEPGMVITCEPGIYIPKEGIGVRLEDVVLITTSGNQILSSALPTRLTKVD